MLANVMPLSLIRQQHWSRDTQVCFSCGCDNTAEFDIKLMLTLIWLMHDRWTTPKFPKCNFQTKPFRSGQEKKKIKGKKPNWMVLLKEKGICIHLRLIWIKGTWIFFVGFGNIFCLYSCTVLDLLSANPIKCYWNINKDVNLNLVLTSTQPIYKEHNKWFHISLKVWT